MKKKILMVTLLAVLFVLALALTNTVNAADDITITDVKSLSGGTLVKNEAGNLYTITLTKDQVNTLEWHAKGDPTGQPGVNRVANGWDIGFKLTLSETFTKGDLKVKYTNYENVVKSFDGTPDDTASEYSCWVSLNENKLKGQKDVFQLAKFEFEIDGNKATVIVKVDPKDVELKLPNDGRMVKVTVGDYEFTMEKGKTLSADEDNGGLSEAEVADLKGLMVKEGYKFVGLFVKGTDKEFTLDQVVTENIELETRFEKLPEEPADEPEEEPVEKDDTPKMGAIDVALIASVIAIVSVSGIVAVKKYNK